MFMEESVVPLHSWFWLIAPMMVVFVISVINFFRNREVISNSNGANEPDDNPKSGTVTHPAVRS